MKKKKDSVLTPEEKLARALVPVEEQPYKVPENWRWVTLGSLSSNQYGFTAKAITDHTLPKNAQNYRYTRQWCRLKTSPELRD